MKLSPEMREVIRDELMEHQLRGPFHFGLDIFGVLAERLWARIADQMEKETPARRQPWEEPAANE